MSAVDHVHKVAGAMVVVSSYIAYAIDIRWLYLTMFVGLNLFQYGFTKFCPLEKILVKMGLDK